MIASLTKSIKSSPFGLIIIIFGILIIGLTSLYSVAEIKADDASNAFLRQLIFLIPALILMMLFSIVPKKIVHEYVYILYILITLSVVIPFFWL